MLGFLKSGVSVVWKRFLLLVVLNWLFFGGIVVGALLGEAGYLEVYRLPFIEYFSTTEPGNAAFMVLSFFVLNLVLSGFLLITLTGVAFFGLSVCFLLFRALLWGVLLNALSTSLFLAVLPTLILEGENYVLACVAGVNLGLSWLKPQWVYKEENLSRSEAFKRAWRDCAYVYVLVAVSLFVAAVVETATIFLIGS
jgi:uncharacterized membrane protein SpoIIM required for sporulation